MGNDAFFTIPPLNTRGYTGERWRYNEIISIIHSFFDYTILYNTNLDYLAFKIFSSVTMMIMMM